MPNKSKILYIVHCVDTEGPLNESVKESVKRFNEIYKKNLIPSKKNLNRIQNKEIKLNGQEESAAKCFSKKLLNYNKNWSDIDLMLDNIMSENFRFKKKDDFGGGWVYSWHCVDHVGFNKNPRKKSLGYGAVFHYYKKKIIEYDSKKDELNWHFHPLSIQKNPLAAATSYTNNYDLLNNILCKRIIDDNYFPSVNRPGFHSERADSNFFLESWIPFDYGNQRFDDQTDQPDMVNKRFGDWERAPKTWRGYNPSLHDYQKKGNLNRYIFRCLNIGTRIRCIKNSHIIEAFNEANKKGSAILAFCNHDYRDMSNDIDEIRNKIFSIKEKFPNVKIKYCGAEYAAKSLLAYPLNNNLDLRIYLDKNIFTVELISGELFGPQPYLAIKAINGNYYHDNFDILIPDKKWIYTLDNQTIKLNDINTLAVGSAGKYGSYITKKINVNESR